MAAIAASAKSGILSDCCIVTAVVSNRSEAPGLELAGKSGIPAVVVESSGIDDLRPHFLLARDHFLLECDGEGPALFGFGLGDLLVSLGLVDLKHGAYVLADLDIGDIDGKYLESGVFIEALLEDVFGYFIGRFEDVLI